MSAIQQAYYTSVGKGPTGNAGFQFVATSDGFDPATLSGVERLLGYRPPVGSSPSPDAAEIASFPILRVFDRLDSGEYVFIRTRYLGEDYSGRFGNYFAHVLVVDPKAAPLSLKPLDLFDLEWWQESGGNGTSFPSPVFPSEPCPAAVLRSAGTDQQLITLASALKLMVDGQHTLYIEDQAASVRDWLDLCYAILPQSVWWDLTFTTFAPDATRAPGRVRFVDPAAGLQLQPYELRSTASLVSSVRESAGPTNPFGRIVGSLVADADWEAFDSLTEKVRLSKRVPTGDFMDGIAIAAGGDPELHDLSEEQSLDAVRVVLATGDQLFTIRHIGWVFDQLTTAQSSDVAELFSASLANQSDLAGGVSQAAFEWFLRNGESSGSGQELASGLLSDAWTEEWFGVLASAEGAEYQQILANGLSLGLAANEERARELGIEIASMVARGQTSIDILSEVSSIPRGAIAEMVEFVLSDQPEIQFDQAVFRHPAIEAELASQMKATKGLDRGLRLWQFAEAMGLTLDEKGVKHLVSLVGSKREAQEVLLAAPGEGSGSFEAQAALVTMCAEQGVNPGSKLMGDFEAGLPKLNNRSLKRLAKLYAELERIGVRTDVGDAIVLLDSRPSSDGDLEAMVAEASEALRGSLDRDLREKLTEHICGFVAATDNPNAHLGLVRRIAACRSDDLEAAYVRKMKDGLGGIVGKGKAGRTGALIFLTWRVSGSDRLGPRNRDKTLIALNEKQRAKVSHELPPRYRSDWDQWCELNPPKGPLARRRARK